MATKLDKLLTGTQITDELQNSLGASEYSLDHDTFFGGNDFDIYTAAASGGTHLIENTHYTLHDEDTDLTTEASKTVYTTVKIIDPTYQTCDLYFTYKTVGDYNEAEDINDLQDLIDALELKHNLLHIRDEKAQNTDGGTFTSGAWQTRDLNTIKTNEITGASLSSNQITLPAGTYWIEARCPAYYVNAHKAKLYNISDTADEIIGSNGNAPVAGYGENASIIKGRITIAAEKIFELQHRCTTTKANNGFGSLSNFATEVYSEIIIRQVS